MLSWFATFGIVNWMRITLNIVVSMVVFESIKTATLFSTQLCIANLWIDSSSIRDDNTFNIMSSESCTPGRASIASISAVVLSLLSWCLLNSNKDPNGELNNHEPLPTQETDTESPKMGLSPIEEESEEKSLSSQNQSSMSSDSTSASKENKKDSWKPSFTSSVSIEEDYGLDPGITATQVEYKGK
mmetsp:Transcript_10108/g.14290  ORF Transcript_10108/g.14290 Transcript_10108/m.14290 type:complete len:186 (+) Transcript_10108:619-1176(+)